MSKKNNWFLRKYELKKWFCFSLIGVVLIIAGTLFTIFLRFNKFIALDFPLYEGPDALMGIIPALAFYLYIPLQLVDWFFLIFKKRKFFFFDVINPIIAFTVIFLSVTYLYK